MERIRVSAYSGAEQLQFQRETETMAPGAGQALVDVEVAGINYFDVYQRNGAGTVPVPFTPGLEGLGRVRLLGEPTSDGERLRVGQRVAWVNVIGSYASELVMPADRALPIPDSFTTPQGLLFQPLTAQYLVTEYRNVRPGDRVLVHAAAGGVGQLLVQWLKHLGAWVVGTTSSDAKASIVRAAGADAVINYGQDYEFFDQLLALTDGRGVDLAFDGIGAATFLTTVKALARGGTAVSFGRPSGPPPPVSIDQLRDRCTRVASGTVFSYIADHRELQQRAAAVVKAIQEGWLRLGAGTSYDLSQAAEAHRAIESRTTQGKLFLTVAR